MRPTPTWRARVSLFAWLHSFDLSGLGVPAGSYATADIALGVTEALKLPHHVKVETPSGESLSPLYVFPSVVCHIKMAQKVSRLYPYSPKKSLLPKNVNAKFIQILLCQSKLCTTKSAPDVDKKCVY